MLQEKGSCFPTNSYSISDAIKGPNDDKAQWE